MADKSSISGSLETHLMSIKKWQEQKAQSMKEIHNAKINKLDADKERLDSLMKNYLESLEQLPNKNATSQSFKSNAKPLDDIIKGVRKTDQNKMLEPQILAEIPAEKQVKSVLKKPLDTFLEKSDGIAPKKLIEIIPEKRAVERSVAFKIPKQSEFENKADDSSSSSLENTASKQMEKLSLNPNSTTEKKKPIRPFLKKGSGLQRYMPRSTMQIRKNAVKSVAPYRGNDFACSRGINVTSHRRNNVVQKEASELAEFEQLEQAAHVSSVQSNPFEYIGLPAKTPLNEKNVLTSTETVPKTSWDDKNKTSDFVDYISELKSKKMDLEQELNGFGKSTENDKENIPESEDEIAEHNQGGTNKAFQSVQIKEKMAELNNEIAIYRDYNDKLAKLFTLREQDYTTLKKEQLEFERMRESQLKQLEEDNLEKRNALKREKSSFYRIQKMKKGTMTKKEREEHVALKQQVSDLQEELKKQSFKYNAECKRLRKLLTMAEQERDNLRAENQKLEMHRSNLMESLEIQKKRNSNLSKNVEKVNIKTHKEIICISKRKSVSSEASSDEETSRQSTCRKQHVRFNLEPDIQSYDPANGEINYHEIHHSDNVERIFINGQKEIHYASGTIEYISADGSHKRCVYYNGDVKEVFSDNRVVYKFHDGAVETRFPEGLRIFEHSNQIEKYYPDGTKQIIFQNGNNIVLYPDGSQELKQADGVLIKSFSDGMNMVEYPSGDKEYRTNDYIRHEYSNGIVRTVYKSGRVETVYTDGRLNVNNQQNEMMLHVN